MAEHTGHEHDGLDLDIEDITRTVAEYPVRSAVLYGSFVRGEATTDSDVDITVAFEEALSSTERLTQRSRLTADLMSALGTNDIDVADLDAIRPAIGASALRTGRLLLGDPTTVEKYLGRFERETSLDQTHDRYFPNGLSRRCLRPSNGQ